MSPGEKVQGCKIGGEGRISFFFAHHLTKIQNEGDCFNQA